MTDWARIDDRSCQRLTDALEFLGRRWNGAVMLALSRGADRFSTIVRMVPGLSDRMLAARLKELEQQGAVEREVVPTTPVQVRYRLTTHGRDLLEAVQPLMRVAGRMVGETPIEPARSSVR